MLESCECLLQGDSQFNLRLLHSKPWRTPPSIASRSIIAPHTAITTSSTTNPRHTYTMSHSLKKKGDSHKSSHPKGTTAKQYNVNRRLYPYPDPEDDKFASGTIRVHSIEGLNPRERILESWTRCRKPKGRLDGTCVSGHAGYYVRLQNGELKAAIKLYGATCEHDGQGGVGDEEEGGKKEGGEGDGEKKEGAAGTGAWPGWDGIKFAALV
ncbi:uncharacterized protein MYCFIDRAFT_170523 [Pseudocercospora fijiensis CIRAD86]|uniref:Uncharacterized protein n=1 Tax=Pseudocercospora fijiensis (strain CIRAD86) TaxID=383855 RepID=N1Q836_PSEFD|nr:uncharacterized protein MYCFIDRAFT_170523 [Pseudocercospora fijiensis CIRAD86]EME88974.1 hypothetical protein MYCFIDRAFT_170523 [Pseudocercospora fijiensis CIRAD86]